MYDWELKDKMLKTWVRLRQASEAVDRVLEVELDTKGTTLAQIDVLALLNVSTTALTPGDIGDFTFRQQHSASAQLSRMWRAGLLKKTRGTKDQRVVRIKIQPKGRQKLTDAGQAGFKEAHELLKSCLSDKELEQLDGLLRKVRDGALQRLGTKAELLPKTIDIPGKCPAVSS